MIVYWSYLILRRKKKCIKIEKVNCYFIFFWLWCDLVNLIIRKKFSIKNIMYFLKLLSIIIFMVVCFLMLIIFLFLVNGFIFGVIVWFKKFCIFLNIFFVNVVLVDFLNVLINMLMYLLYGVLEVSWFKGKILVIFLVYLSWLFIFFYFVLILLLLVNVFLGIVFDFWYFVWKMK